MCCEFSVRIRTELELALVEMILVLTVIVLSLILAQSYDNKASLMAALASSTDFNVGIFHVP